MSTGRYVLLLLIVLSGAASTQLAHAGVLRRPDRSFLQGGADGTPLAVVAALPTVAVPQATPVAVPTVAIPRPTLTPTPKPHPTRRRRLSNLPRLAWIWAFLTSYCPGTAGWLSASGRPVFYGMLANDYYPFGTRVYIPVLGMTGVVADRFGGAVGSDHFDVWSPTCYGTPTGWFKVAIVY